MCPGEKRTLTIPYVPLSYPLLLLPLSLISFFLPSSLLRIDEARERSSLLRNDETRERFPVTKRREKS